MTKYFKLKKGEPGFRLADGPGAGKRFQSGRGYRAEEIPPSHRHKFEEVRKISLPPKNTSAEQKKVSAPKDSEVK